MAERDGASAPSRVSDLAGEMTRVASRCPLCGQPNACALADPVGGSGECWCFTATIPGSALERIPAEQRGAACICAACALQEEAASRPARPHAADHA